MCTSRRSTKKVLRDHFAPTALQDSCHNCSPWLSPWRHKRMLAKKWRHFLFLSMSKKLDLWTSLQKEVWRRLQSKWLWFLCNGSEAKSCRVQKKSWTSDKRVWTQYSKARTRNLSWRVGQKWTICCWVHGCGRQSLKICSAYAQLASRCQENWESSQSPIGKEIWESQTVLSWHSYWCQVSWNKWRRNSKYSQRGFPSSRTP